MEEDQKITKQKKEHKHKIKSKSENQKSISKEWFILKLNSLKLIL